jgi:hypothetical protein
MYSKARENNPELGNIGKKIARGATKLYKEIMNYNYIKKYMINLLSENEFDLLDI